MASDPSDLRAEAEEYRKLAIDLPGDVMKGALLESAEALDARADAVEGAASRDGAEPGETRQTR
jgi:hypothetical protein